MADANRLIFGDSLDVLREEVEDQSVDLIYLDPPFKSKRIYNVFFGGAQTVAFKDTWQWYEAEGDYDEVVQKPGALTKRLEGFRGMLGTGSDLAYLSYMANRLRECKRVLKPEGSIYLHCDPEMSHYLKVLMDGLFDNFLSEFIWWYSGGGASKRYWAKKHDVLLYYAASNNGWTFNADPVRSPYKWTDGQRRADGSERDLDAGKLPDDVWQHHSLMPWSKERNHASQGGSKVIYETQKPLALLDRILRASSNEGDVVLDPFCGCGTTIHAAQLLGRRWIGIDVCVTACKVIRRRLDEHFKGLWNDVEYIGIPKTLGDAAELAKIDPFRFERWAASLIDGMEYNKTQRRDKGIDGNGRFQLSKGRYVDIVAQVKGGGTGPSDVQAFNGARQQAGAELGIFTCFDGRVTMNMRDAAASTGRFMGVPCIQIYTIDDYFAGRHPVMPKVA